MGFKPTVFFNTLVFKTNALNRSTIYPKALFYIKKQLKGFEPLTLTLARLHSAVELQLLSVFVVYTKGIFNECIKNDDSLIVLVLYTKVMFNTGKFVNK